MEDNLILVGVISSAYHLKGLVKISSFTSDPKNICNNICYDKKGNEYKLKFIKNDKKKIVARIEGIDNRTKAEEILKTKLYIYRNSLPELGDAEHYISDLVGMDVLDIEDNKIGKVKAFHNFGAGDIVEVALDGKKSEMYPFTKEIFLEITDEFIRMKP